MTDEGSNAPGESAPARQSDVACSFCGKGRDKVRKLISGPHVYICDECVELCEDIIEGAYDLEWPPVDELPNDQSALLKHTADCAICRLPASLNELLAIGARGFLCAACLEAVRRAAEQAGPGATS